MRQSIAVMCQDATSLQLLGMALNALGIDKVTCDSPREIIELALGGHCSAVIVDFDLPGAGDVVKMAALLQPPQKPVLLAIASRAWPGTGQAFQSGADRILYKPLAKGQLHDAFLTVRELTKKNRRRSSRHEMKTVVYLEVETGTLPSIGIDISEHGFAVQATEPVPMGSNLSFRCLLPDTDYTLRGHADVIWASDHGRAGLFFSRLTPSARKRLKQWLNKRGAQRKDAVRILRQPVDSELCTVSE